MVVGKLIAICIYTILAFCISTSIATSLHSVFQNSKDLIWFPSSDGDGKLIPAKLRPTENDDLRPGDINDVHFYLYTRNNPNPSEGEELFPDDLGSIDNSHFINGAPLKFLVHGFGSSYLSGFPSRLREEYLALNQNYNIIAMDWEPLAAAPDYFLAFENAVVVSSHAAKFIDFLVDNGRVTRENIHLIGYSLGGQVVGQIGSRMAQKVARITALDPALPLFDYASEFNRTDASDAIFVDVIHVAANGFLAYKDPCGHVDWYPNGGGYQPGCGVDPAGSCAHNRAPAMYTESILSQTGFYGRECNSYENFLAGQCNSGKIAQMGEYTPSDTQGVFFLRSRSEFPFALGPEE